MKVKELIEELENFDPEADCVYASDDEGNEYHEVFYKPSEGKYYNRSYMTIEDCIEDDDLEWQDKAKRVICIN